MFYCLAFTGHLDRQRGFFSSININCVHAVYHLNKFFTFFLGGRVNPDLNKRNLNEVSSDTLKGSSSGKGSMSGNFLINNEQQY